MLLLGGKVPGISRKGPRTLVNLANAHGAGLARIALLSLSFAYLAQNASPHRKSLSAKTRYRTWSFLRPGENVCGTQAQAWPQSSVWPDFVLVVIT
jgi:hypothetical protein